MSTAAPVATAVEFVPFRDILRRVERKVLLDDSETYQTVGVRWYGKGAFIRDRLLGAAIARKQQWVVRVGDVIYNKLFAWKGAFAIAGPEVDGHVASDKFPTYELDSERANPRYLAYYFQSPRLARQAADLSKGAAAISKLTLNPPQFWDLTIPLPSASDQTRIVAWLDAVAARSQEIDAKRVLMRQELESLSRSIMLHATCVNTQLGDIVTLRRVDVSVVPDDMYQFVGVYSFGRGVFSGPRKAGRDFAYKLLTKVRRGDFIYPKLMAWEGAFGAIPDELDGCYASPEFPVFQLDQGRVLPETLDIYFRTPSVWARVAGSSAGTNVRRRRLHPSRFLESTIPLPSLGVQRRLQDVRRRSLKLVLKMDIADAELSVVVSTCLDAVFKA